MKNFYIDSLGCKVNSYEIEAIKDELLLKGYQKVDINEADVIILNTCCVTNTAASKSRQKIHSLHQKNPLAKIIVMGCYVQGFEEEVKKIEGVYLLVGTKNRRQIIQQIEALNQQISLVEDLSDYTIYENLSISSSLENTRAYLKIQDGCNNFCSYCIIPYVRGTVKSRLKEDIIEEAKKLIQLGYKELVLTGIHTGHYGKDLDNYTFTDLIEELLNIKGLYRLRISSIEESEITSKLIDLMKNNDKLAKHLHIPLQAGSDKILKLMNRKYDVKTFLNKIQYIQNNIEDIAITTDVIVGFPQESEENFNETLKICQELHFSKIHVFPYSARKGTIAATMKGQVNGKIKKERAKKLIELSNQLNLEYNQKYLNKEVEVLIEENCEGYYIGHTTNYIKVKIQSQCSLNRNEIVKVKVLQASCNDVIAVYKEEKI